jgi:signal transduction histidine kinase
MGEHRRRSRVVVAGLVGVQLAAAAVLVPRVREALPPAVVDVAAGWVLLAVGVALLARDRVRTGALVWLAGAIWVLVGLAPFLPAVVVEPVERLALVPHALLVGAVVLGVVDPAWTRLRGAAVLTAGSVAALAGAGIDVRPLLTLGVVPLLVAVAERGLPAAARVRLARVATGGGLVLVGVASVRAAVSATVVANGVAVVLAVGAGTLLAVASSDPWAVGPPGEPGVDLGGAIARALGTRPVTVAFATAGGTRWLDVAGRPVATPTDGATVVDTRGDVLAVIEPTVAVPAPALVALRQLLEAAAARAALRAAERDQAAAIAASRERLQRAGDVERELLERRLRLGTVARLDRIVEALGAYPTAAPARDRAVGARDDLLAIARGLDPLGSHASLDEALAALVASSSAAATLAGDVGGSLPAASARAAWYACSEALANAVKHAPGSAVCVDVAREGDRLRIVVADDGPGGGDPAGSGLRGLADRVGAVGGSVSVSSTHAGTTIEILVPAVEAR